MALLLTYECIFCDYSWPESSSTWAGHEWRKLEAYLKEVENAHVVRVAGVTGITRHQYQRRASMYVFILVRCKQLRGVGHKLLNSNATRVHPAMQTQVQPAAKVSNCVPYAAAR
jgi:hypothetical protein